MTVVASGEVELSVRQEQFERGMRRAGQLIGGFTLAAAGAGVALLKITKDFADHADQLQKTAIRINTTTEALSEYQHVADLTGVKFNTLTTAWQRQNRRISEAAKGYGTAKAALQELNLSAEQLVKLKTDEQFEIIAGAISKVPVQADRARLSMALWDTEGVQLLQTIDGGVDAIRNMRKEAHDLGLTISTTTAKEMENLNDKMTKFKGIITGMGRRIAVEVAGPLLDLAQKAETIFEDLFPSERDSKRFMIAESIDALNRSLFENVNILKKKIELERIGAREAHFGANRAEEIRELTMLVGDQAIEVERLREQWRALAQPLDETEAKANKVAVAFTRAKSKLEDFIATLPALSETSLDAMVRTAPRLPENLEKSGEATDELTKKTKRLTKNITDVDRFNYAYENLGATLQGGFADAIVDNADNIGRMNQSFKEAAVDGAKRFISAMVQIGVQRLITSKIFQSADSQETATNTANSATRAAAAAPAAAAMSISSFGTAALAGAAALATTFALAKALSRGQAHEGFDSVARTGSYYLERGERVVASNQNIKLTKFLDRQEKGGMVPVQVVLNVQADDSNSFIHDAEAVAAAVAKALADRGASLL